MLDPPRRITVGCGPLHALDGSPDRILPQAGYLVPPDVFPEPNGVLQSSDTTLGTHPPDQLMALDVRRQHLGAGRLGLELCPFAPSSCTGHNLGLETLWLIERICSQGEAS